MDWCSHQFHNYQNQTSFDVPDYIKKRLRNFHIPGHSEILVYAFHHSGLFDKNFLRDIFDTVKQRDTINDVFSKLKSNLDNFVPVKLSPLS